MAGNGTPRGGRSPHIARILRALERRADGMTVSEMAALVSRDRRSLQGSLASLRVRGEIVPTDRWRGREVYYVRGRAAAPARPRFVSGALPVDRPTGVDDAQVREVFAMFARWGRRSAGAA